ncbi:MAG: hypothetical protein N4A54_03920 [Peptostreptococcaceae bacterium]|jgi:hypothetical protein|nr:hypothetical protein [Peptostreptococcaceae bacterium]
MEAIDFISGWTKWLLLIIPVGAACRITYLSTQKSFSLDDDTIIDCNKKIKNTLYGSAIGMTISGLVTIIKTFYT